MADSAKGPLVDLTRPNQRYFVKSRGVKVGNSPRKLARRREISVTAIKMRIASIRFYGAGKGWRREVAKHGRKLARKNRQARIDAKANSERERIRASVKALAHEGE